jgi:oligoendopeptidase F
MARKSSRRRKRRSGINIKKSNRGKLRKTAKAKKGKKIPVSKLRAMKRSKNPTTRKRATFALNARSWNKGGKKR